MSDWEDVTTEEKSYAVKQQMKLCDALLSVVEDATKGWEDDPRMTDRTIGAVLMAAATSFSGDMLAMVSRAMGREESMESGADIIRNGALAMAKLSVKMMEDDENVSPFRPLQ